MPFLQPVTDGQGLLQVAAADGRSQLEQGLLTGAADHVVQVLAGDLRRSPTNSMTLRSSMTRATGWKPALEQEFGEVGGQGLVLLGQGGARQFLEHAALLLLRPGAGAGLDTPGR